MATSRGASLPFDVEDNVFLLPGPVKIHPRILRAMMAPAIGHRSSDFKTVIRNITRGLQYLFQTKGRVAVLTASASAGMEAAVSNLVGPGDRIAVVVNGKFGERFAEIAKRYCPQGTVLIETPMGAPADLGRLEELLAAGGVKAVAAVLNESSAGVQNPGEKIADLCRRFDAFFIADGVTAVGGVDVPVDKWGIDVCIVGSQKCLGAPPGVAYLSCSDEAFAAFRSPSLYLDLKALFSKWADEETPFTPATHLFLATQAALDLLAEETLEKRIQRTRRLAHAFRAACAAIGLPLLAHEATPSDTITAVRYPAAVTEAQVRDVLRSQFGIVVAGGQGDLKGKIVRLGHLGFYHETD
ncbi:MAG TPA: alanine--glyoxylate aminotransferase family protein, partial [Candidatus Thermoplasmatota archaeon]|nr:alanine--glyoxylate aminotransferase family protein [Candidatus Thermoplasmatota archaeon]